MTGNDDLQIKLGMEEEFFLVDPESRDLLADPDHGIFEDCRRHGGPHTVVPEVLRAQIETNTRICESIAELDTAVREVRKVVIDIAGEYGVGVMAASTHPFAAWRDQVTTPMQRYERFVVTYQESIRRMLVGGMHIHAGFGDQDSRVRIMTSLRRYLPFMHALSASSPFSGGNETGLKSYRLNLIGVLPRSGMPGPFHSRAEFDRLVADYVRMEAINDSSEMWWDIRPGARYPTVEMRICDVCSRVEDAITVAAIYACLIRRLIRRDRKGGLPPEPPTEMIAENRWLAQRYGVLSFLGNLEEGGRTDIQDYATALLEELAEDASALGCEDALRRAPRIIYDGTSADRQIDLFRLRILEGDTKEAALKKVVDQAVAETREGVAAAA